VVSRLCRSGRQMDQSHNQVMYNIIGTNLVKRHSECVNVTRLLQSASHEPFRCHPVASAYNSRSIRACCATRGIGFHTGEAEVAQYGRSAVINQHIKLKCVRDIVVSNACTARCINATDSLQITMHNLVGVEVNKS
jgi:hypothetical protein